MTDVLTTDRLVLRRFRPDDAGFILELMNDPSFIQNIGDKGVRTEADARRYIVDIPMASYERFGFGLYLVVLKETGEAAGMCGLVKRDALPDVDVGFAFLPRFWSKGYAFEAASAVMEYGRTALGLGRIVAIVDPSNLASIRVLEKLGLRYERTFTMPGFAGDTALYS